MAHDRAKVFERAKKATIDEKLIFVEEVVSYSGVSKATFYEMFPLGSDGLNEIKEIIDRNKDNIKAGLRKKWYENDNATTQIALYKLTSRAEERLILANTEVQIRKDVPELNWGIEETKE